MPVANTPAAKKNLQKKTEPCKHYRLHFEDGGLHIACNGCKCRWVCIGENKFDLPDINARSMGLTNMDNRHDPFGR